MAATVMSVAPPIRPCPDSWTVPDRLRLVPTLDHPPATAPALHDAEDKQALRTEAFRWLRDLSNATKP